MKDFQVLFAQEIHKGNLALGVERVYKLQRLTEGLCMAGVEELRSSVRFPIKLPIAVVTSDRRLEAQTENISSGGVLFRMASEVPVGSTIHFSIAMPASVLGTPADVIVNCVGRVVRCSIEGEERNVAAVIDEYHFDRG